MQDAILDPRVTAETIATAAEHIDAMYPQVVDAYFKQRLVDIQCYLQACLDNQSDADDIYSVKYNQYKSMLNDTLKSAQSGIKESAGISVITIEMGRA